MRRRAAPPPPPPPPLPEVDLNQVVAYNVRAARELRGWTQDELARRLEPYVGQLLSQGAVSAIERAWDGERRREFDAHELLVFAMVFDLPIVWFLLAPPGDHRLMRATTRPVDELYAWLLGRPDQLDPVYERLRQVGIYDPTAAEEVVEKITGAPSDARQWSYRERRKELLLALLNQHADALDHAVDELGRWVDHLRQVGIRGFVAEHTGDSDYARVVPPDVSGPLRALLDADRAGSGSMENETAPGGTADEKARGERTRETTTKKRARRQS